MGLKDIYSLMEEKYYSALDRLNESIPIYSIIDPIDRVIPSLLLLLVVSVLLLGFGAFFFLATPPALSESTIAFIVKNNDGHALANAKIIVSGAGLVSNPELTTNKSGRAEIRVPFGAELNAIISKRNYSDKTQLVLADQDSFEVNVFLEKEVTPPEPHTISFAAPNSTKIIGTEIQATFECTNALVQFANPSQITTTGDITVTPPSGCGLLTVRATTAGYQVLEEVIDLPAKLLTFKAFPIPKGEILFFIKDNLEQSLNGIKTSIFDLSDFPQSTPRFSDRGEVSFSLEPGDYRAVIDDETGNFPAQETTFTINANATVTKEIVLSKNPAATLKISVKDKSNGARINGAKVVLKKNNGDVLGERKISFSDQQAIFAVAEKGIYKYIAAHEDFLPGEEKEIDLSSAAPNSSLDLNFELEKCTPQTCGVLEVTVVDEDGNPVENAAVIIHDAATSSIAREFEQRATDFEGKITAYQNVGKKEYYAVAQKYPATGKSSALLVDPLAVNQLTVEMKIGTGEINIEAADLQGVGIPFATAKIKKADGTTLATISLDEKGKGKFETKADKKVFVVVSKDGYASYTSVLRQVFKNDKIRVKAELLNELTNNEIEVKYLGVFDPNGALVTDNLTAQSTYFVKAQLLVPKNYKSAGLHFRVGNKSTLGEDKIFIKSFNAPQTTAIAGKSYSPPTGETADIANLSSGDAKWINLLWSQPEKGIYNAEFEIVIRPQTALGTQLPIHYRAWAVTDADAFKRHPQDTELGEAKEVSTKQELFASVFTQNFFEGSKKICGTDFCYSQRVLDLKEELVLPQAPFAIRVFDDYNFSFEITNNGSTVFDNADLRIKNTIDGVTTDDAISIESYKIENADSVEFTSTSAVFALENPLDAGYYSPFRSIRGKMTLQAKQIKDSELELKIVSGSPAGVEVFNKKIAFEPVSGQQTEINVSPEVLGALIPINLDIAVTFSGGTDNGKPLSGARVIVTRIDPSFNETIQETITDTEGKAAVAICGGAGCSPGTKIVIEVQKAGIQPNSVEKEIAEYVVEFSPQSLEFNLDLTDVTEEQQALEILNLIPMTLKIQKIVLRGSFDGVIDIDRMAAFLQQYIGVTEIEFGTSKTINVLAALNNSAQFLEGTVSPTGGILIDLIDTDNKFVWSAKEIPLKTIVNLSQPPKEENCINISAKEWSDSALETSTTKDFTISNNCVSTTGVPLDLRNLQATIDWRGDEITGQVMLTITNPKTGETVSQVLQQGIQSSFISSVLAQDEYLATLTFVPKPSKVGKAAQFNVKIDAEQLTPTGQQFVGSSNDITANLLIINLSKCITAEPGFNSVLELGKDDSGTITISTQNCGAIPIDLRLCHNDSGCTGGAGEGSISLSKTEFLGIVEDSVEVQVRRESIPGIYGVRIEARPRGGGWREIGDALVSLDPKTGAAFELSKYDFIIIGNGATDSATLTNNDLIETVTVDASACDWKTAKEENNFFDFAGAGVGAAVGGLLGAKPALEAARNTAQAVAAPKAEVAVGAISETTTAEGLTVGAKASADTAIETTKTAATSVNAITPCTGITGPTGALELAKAAMATSNSATATTETPLTGATTNMQAAVSATTKAQTTVASAAGPTASVQTAAAAEELSTAAGSVTSAISQTETACTALADAIVDSDIVQEKLALHITLATEKMAEWAAACGVPATAPVACPAEKACAASIAETQDAIPLVGNSTTNQTAAQAACQNAATAQGTAEGELTSAAGTLTGLGAEEAAMSGAFDLGTFAAIEGLQAGLGFAGGGLLGGLLGDDPCDARHQYPVQDYKINLKRDGRNVDIGTGGIEGSWEPSEAFVFGDYDYQEVGVLFTNAGKNESKPVYAITEFSATKHSQSDPTIIKRGKSNFGPFNVPDRTTETYTQKFHLRFKTGEEDQPLPAQAAETASCVSGVNIGLSGSDATPKISLDWSWNNFSINSCDVANPNAVYCDATQFNFEIVEKLDALKEFIGKNREKLVCPVNPQTGFADGLVVGLAEQIQSGELPATGMQEQVALTSYTYVTTKDSITVSAIVSNNSGSASDATVEVRVAAPQGAAIPNDSCTISFSSIPAGGTQTQSCTISGLLESAQNYSVTVELDADNSFEFKTKIQSYLNCWMPASTELYDGRPALDYFVEEIEPSIEWTNRIPDRQALNDLLVFNAYLIKDGYTNDFLNDFEKYSNDAVFFNAPSYFNSIAANAAGERYGFDAFYKNKNISFSKKYVGGEAQLARGGIYRVELLVKWGGDWQFFDNQGSPFATVEVLMQLLQEPSPNNPFYHLPFDGLVGQVGENSLERQGYGTGFFNENNKTIALNSQVPVVKTLGGSNSNALVTANVEFKDDLFSLNTNPLTRGNILSIESTGTEAQINFFPSIATPVMMKMHSEQTDNPFGAFYGVFESENRVNAGDVLAYWSGDGACIDFSGTTVTDAFDDTPDRIAVASDGIQNWENNYTMQWGSAVRKGDVFLKTIFYTNPQKINDLVAEGNNPEFLTPDEGPNQRVSLNGIDGMEFNSKISVIESIEHVFALVKSSGLCTTSTGRKVSFWRNPKTILEQVGSATCLNCDGQRSIEKESAALVASQTCIGSG